MEIYVPIENLNVQKCTECTRYAKWHKISICRYIMQHKSKTNLIIVFIELSNKNMKYTVCKNTIQINFLFFETNNNLFVKFFFTFF